MSESGSVLAQIYAHPDDDGPRLIYADELQQRGDPLGDFIQLQCRLAAAPDDERRRAMRVAENKLLAAHADDWTALLPQEPGLVRYAFGFRRGFIEHVKLHVAALPAVGALCKAAPLLRSLDVVSGEYPTPPLPADAFAPLAGCRIERLELGVLAGDAAAVALARAPLPHLRELRPPFG